MTKCGMPTDGPIRLLEGMPEDLPDRMSEGMPERTKNRYIIYLTIPGNIFSEGWGRSRVPWNNFQQNLYN